MKKASDLIGKNIIVYDLETKESPPDVGWTAWNAMGISVGCSYDFLNDSYGVYLDDNMHKLVERLNKPETLIVAFNQIGFDNNLLRNCKNKFDELLNHETLLNSYDMLIESRRAANVNKFSKGFKLDDHLKAMKMDTKTACGSIAPKLYKEGNIGELIDYCLNDVRVERNLFNHLYCHGWIQTLKHGRHDIKLPLILQQKGA